MNTTSLNQGDRFRQAKPSATEEKKIYFDDDFKRLCENPDMF